MRHSRSRNWKLLILFAGGVGTILGAVQVFSFHTGSATQGPADIGYSRSDGEQKLEGMTDRYIETNKGFIVNSQADCLVPTEGFFINTELSLDGNDGQYFFQTGVENGFRFGTFELYDEKVLRVSNFATGQSDMNVDIALPETPDSSESLSLRINLITNPGSTTWTVEVELNGRLFRGIRPMIGWSCEGNIFGSGRSWEQSWESDIAIQYGQLETVPKSQSRSGLVLLSFSIVVMIGLRLSVDRQKR